MIDCAQARDFSVIESFLVTFNCVHFTRCSCLFVALASLLMLCTGVFCSLGLPIPPLFVFTYVGYCKSGCVCVFNFRIVSFIYICCCHLLCISIVRLCFETCMCCSFSLNFRYEVYIVFGYQFAIVVPMWGFMVARDFTTSVPLPC